MSVNAAKRLEHGGDRGGIIELAVDAGRVRFDVNIRAAAAHKIRLSSRLLRLARATVRGPA